MRKNTLTYGTKGHENTKYEKHEILKTRNSRNIVPFRIFDRHPFCICMEVPPPPPPSLLRSNVCINLVLQDGWAFTAWGQWWWFFYIRNLTKSLYIFRVDGISSSSVRGPQAYILFYQKMEPMSSLWCQGQSAHKCWHLYCVTQPFISYIAWHFKKLCRHKLSTFTWLCF